MSDFAGGMRQQEHSRILTERSLNAGSFGSLKLRADADAPGHSFSSDRHASELCRAWKRLEHLPICCKHVRPAVALSPSGMCKMRTLC